MEESNWGLVLAGGGAKGAYQIGVWKAMIEYGIMEQIGGISGDSIGAINEALIAGTDYDTARQIWDSLTFLTVFDTEPELIDMVEGTFSRNEMLDLMREHLDYQKIANYPYPLCVNMTRIGTSVDGSERVAVYETLNGKTDNQIEQIILASSALPIIYEAVNMDGYYYRDGGLTDNLPIKPLYDRGYRHLVVIALEPDKTINTDLYPDCEILLIRPSQSLGDLTSGTLNFSKRDIQMRIELGYRDGLRTLKNYFSTEKMSAQGIQAIANVDYEDIMRSVRQDRVADSVNSHMDQLQSILNKYDTL